MNVLHIVCVNDFLSQCVSANLCGDAYKHSFLKIYMYILVVIVWRYMFK